MLAYFLAFLIGIIAGLRSMTAPAAVSWAARLGWLHLENTWLAFMGFAVMPYIWTVLAIGELIADKLPAAPSRKAPVGFSGRILTGALSGAGVAMGSAAVGSPNTGASSSWVIGLVAGVLGAIVGTLGGYEFRARLVKAVGGRDLPIALLEDAIAILGALLIVSRFLSASAVTAEPFLPAVTGNGRLPDLSSRRLRRHRSSMPIGLPPFRPP